MTGHQYYVIQFLEAPYKEMADYVCVPSSWVQTRGPIDPKVKVAYPDEDLLATERKVKKRNLKLDQWKSYLSVVKYGTDSYGDAKRYIQELLDNEDDKPRRSSRKPTPSSKIMPNPENYHKSTNTIAQKREALPDFDEEAHNKRSKVTEPNEIIEEVAGPTNQAFKFMSGNQSLADGMSVDDLCTQEASVSKEISTVNENTSETKHSLETKPIAKQECFGEFWRGELQELQTNLQVCTTTLITKAMKKIMSIVNACSASQSNNQFASTSKKLPQAGTNETQAQANDSDDDQLLMEISFQNRNNKVVVPPKYDKNYSRWTLKYHEPAPGLVELMEHSGVYVNAEKLAEYKKLSNNCQTLAQMLLSEIFTTNALSVCGLGNNFGISGKHDEPELDSHATVTLLKFVAEYGLEQDWEVDDYDCILNEIHKKLRQTKNERERERRTQEPRNSMGGGYGSLISFSKHSSKRRFVLPPEYNKDDSKWTLKYREPAPELVELMKHSGVYVNALGLAKCKRLSIDGKTLARMLLTEIFTTSALSTCSWTGARARAFDQNGRNVRPGLDEHARTVLLNYVADCAKKEGFNYGENQSILHTLRNKMQEMRFKYKS